MLEAGDVASLRTEIQKARRNDLTVGLVPTMGYLHDGHLALVDEGRRGCDLVVMSIFVNPTQFGPREDLARYPRDLERDRRLAEESGVDVLFAPDVVTMYPEGPDSQQVWVEPGPLATYLDGESRPGHFRGVCTVVAKLFNMVQPDRAYFGQKDAQQALILSRLVKDLSYQIELRIVPTVRDASGLALSSRNVYLTAGEREEATALIQSLKLVQSLISSGERGVAALTTSVRECVASLAPSAGLDYVSIADLRTLLPVEDDIQGDVLIALAVHFGSTRLIDNTIARFYPDGPRFS